MNQWLVVINAAAVGIFGVLLSAAFTQIRWQRRQKLLLLAFLAFTGLLQVGVYLTFGAGSIRTLYPLITHLPLVVFLGLLSGSWLWSLVSVLTAYLCCQLRRWIALFAVAAFSGGEMMQNLVELAVTVPLLVGLIRYAAPAVRSMGKHGRGLQMQIGLLPIIHYGFDYVTRVYTDWLARGIPAAVEFMPFVCVLAYLAFAIHLFHSTRRQSQLEQAHAVLDLQVRSARQQIGELQHAQALTAAYRHDLRHHLQYLSACMETGSLEQARNYIRELDQAVTSQTVTQYCENTTVNLTLSAFAERAAQANVKMHVHVRLGEDLTIPQMDLCVLLSNALENALHACQAAGTGAMEVRCFTKGERVFLEITNPCPGPVSFENGLPVAGKAGHGFGVRSIVAVAEKYGGLYSFQQEGDTFILRVSL